MALNRIVLAVIVLTLVTPSWLPASGLAGRGLPKENTPFLLEERYDKEPDPKQRVLIALKLTDVRIKELQTVYKRGASTLQKEAGESYVGAAERLEKAVEDAIDMGYSKRAEQHLRRHLRELENLKMAVSFQERPAVEEIATRVAKIQEKILYRIMQPRQESARR